MVLKAHLFTALLIYSLKELVNAANCPLDRFQCESDEKLCIPKLYVCDFTGDCPDGSDERKNCTLSACNFENGNDCGWSSNGKDITFKWKIGKASDVTEKYLPKTDSSSSRKGYYSYIIGQKGLITGVDRLMSNVFSRSGSECYISFSYHCDMYNCPLQIFKSYSNKSEDLIWDPFDHFNFENTSAKWRLTKAFIGINQNFRISFKAKQHFNFHFGIAIDNINFHNCSLPKYSDVDENCDSSTHFKCNNGHCIDKEKMCDFTNDCIDNSDENSQICKSRVGNCDFETDCNSWRDDKVISNSFVKTIPRFSSNLANIPKSDHTTRTLSGTFLNIKSTRRTGDYSHRSRIISNVISKNSKSCRLRFWVNIIGENKQNLITVFKRFESGNEVLLLQHTSTDVADFWERLDINLISENEPFELIIEANARRIGSVSIDDISFSSECVFLPRESFTARPTTLQPISTETTSSFNRCPYNAYQCKTVERCYYANEICNFRDDCGDNTDEEQCGYECDFEKECPWFVRTGFFAHWYKHSGPSFHRNQNTGPKFDHTFGNYSGHYLVTNGTKYHWNISSDSIELESHYYYNSSKRCKLQFYYHMFGKNMGTLKVLLNDARNKNSLLWSINGDKGDKWSLASVFIGERPKRFDISIEAVFGEGQGPKDFAIDDLKLIDCEPSSIYCKSDEEMCKDNLMCYKVWQKCDGIYDCKDKSDEIKCVKTKGSCNFDDGENWLESCQWTNLQEDFKWETATVPINKNTGPQSLLSEKDRQPSHENYRFASTKFDQFLYLNSTGKETGDKALIVTPIFPASSDVCHLTYFYYMYGSPKIGVLRVSLFSENNQFIKQISEMTGNHGPQWIANNYMISSEKPFKVVFEGIVGESGLSDIAIDDVRFSLNCLDGKIPIAPTNCSGFNCGDGFCIPSELMCNCEKDCKDESDEIGCNIDCKSDNSTYCDRKGHFECFKSQRVCIPGIMVCDGIVDCPDGEDESDCPFTCEHTDYFCRQGNDSACRPLTETCDGKDHCLSDYDESLCGVNECPKNYCGKIGECVVSAGLPYCKGCIGGDIGKRCFDSTSTVTSNILPTTVNKTTENNSNELKKSKTYPYSVISMGIMSLVILIAVIVIFVVRKTDRCDGNSPMTFDNPIYELENSHEPSNVLVN